MLSLSNLTWNSHVVTVTLEAGLVLNLIRRNFRNAHRYVKERLYMSIARSILKYAAVI